MKNLIVFILLLFPMCIFAQDKAETLFKIKLRDVNTKKKTVKVDKGTIVEVVKGIHKGYYTVNYEGNEYLVFADNIKLLNPQEVTVGKNKIPEAILNSNDFNQTKINQSILFTNYCLNKYRKEQLTGVGLGIAGAALTVIGGSEENNELMIIGGVAAFGGFILNLSSYRWLKRAYAFPLENGVGAGVQINF